MAIPKVLWQFPSNNRLRSFFKCIGIILPNSVNVGQATVDLRELTGLRFFAAAAVVLFHTFPNTGPRISIADHLLAKGYLGVDLFFILSGFILMHVYFPIFKAGSFSYSDFLRNRFARVYPLHLLILTIFIFVYLAASLINLAGAGEGMNWSHLPWHILALHAWGLTNGHSWNFPSWSISAEFFAYLIFPLFLKIASLLKPRTSLIIAVTSFLVAFQITKLFGTQLTTLMYNFGIIRIFFEFFIGVALFLVFQKTRYKATTSRVVFTLSAVFTLILCSSNISDIVIVPCLALIIFATAHMATGTTKSVLSSKLLVYLGEISYSTYMIHYLVLEIARKLAPKIGLEFQTILVISTAYLTIYFLSIILYHFIELPMRIKIRNLKRPSK